MAGIESDGRSADSALTFDEPGVNPYNSTDDPTQLSDVWKNSDDLRRLLLYGRKKGIPNDAERVQLKGFLVYQLNTLLLYWRMDQFLSALKDRTAPSKTISLYIVLFPGEAKDNTGIKDLNDKVIGQWWTGEFIRRRFDAIASIFTPTDKFEVAAQTYKTAYIITYERTRKDFAAKLAELDGKLCTELLDILDRAEKGATPEQKAEIKKLRKKLKKKKYRFDIFFGLRTLKPSRTAKLVDVYLLVTEALKGAAIARYVAKVRSLRRGSRKYVTSIDPDSRKLDARGKEYDWGVYMIASGMAEKIKDLFVKEGYSLNSIYVDTVWTYAFIQVKNLYWGNPDTIRDVRKKKLESPPLKYSFGIQKDLLELWLVVLNMLDFVKRFKFDEFRKEVPRYHDDALVVYAQVDTAPKDIDWAKLERVLTHDVRQKEPIAVFESASEFQFYSYAADYFQRIFFFMDIRDLGVELMLYYELSNRVVGHEKYSDTDLMEETFRASDEIDERRRFTYDRVLEVFKKYYDLLSNKVVAPIVATTWAHQAFGGPTPEPLGSFTESVQIMLGGDEVYAAVHPLFAQHVPAIVGDLDKTAYDDGTIDLRASVAFSSAKKAKDPSQQRLEIQLSHQEAMKLSQEAPGTLKQLERTQRRIERLVDMLEANDKKKQRGPGYRKELEALPLIKVFARVKYGKPERLTPPEFEKLLKALRVGDIAAAQKTKNFELVDFNGKVIDGDKLEKDAAALEEKVRRDVGIDNVRLEPPPLPDKKTLKKLIDLLRPKKPKGLTA